MTWNTSRGNRILKGKEAKLFINAFAYMMDWVYIMGEEYYNTENCKFNNINHNQKSVIFKEMLTGLFFESELCVDLNQYNECAIYYVFNALSDAIDDIEVFENVWGQDIIDTYEEVWPFEDEINSFILEDDEEYENDRPYIGCLDKEKWESAVNFLKEQILYDEDFTGMIPLLLCDLQLRDKGIEMCTRMGVDKNAFEIKHIDEKDNIDEEISELVHKIETQLNAYEKRQNDAARVIQNGCHNWIWSPLCKDNTVGIRPRLDYQFCKTLQLKT